MATYYANEQGYQQQLPYPALQQPRPKPRSRVRAFLAWMLSFVVSVVAYGAQAYFAHSAQNEITTPPSPAPIVWHTVNSQEGRFTVQMPGKPREMSRPLSSTNAASPRYIYEYSRAGGPEYRVEYADFKVIMPAYIDDSLQAFVGALAEDGKVVSQQNVKLQGYPGVQFEIADWGGNSYVWGRVVMAGDRMYVQAAAVPNSARELHANDVAKFFDSFEISQ